MTKDFNEIKIKNSHFLMKNLLLFLIPVILPVLILGSFSILITQQYLQENIDMYNINLLEQVKFQIDMIFKEIESTYYGLLNNPEINNNLKRILKNSQLSAGGQISVDDYKLIRYINNTLKAQVKSKNYLQSIYIYYDNYQKNFLSSNSGMIFNNDYYDTDWQKEFSAEQSESKRWTSYRRIYPDGYSNPPIYIISLYRNIINNGKSEGLIVLNIFADYVENILSGLDTMENQTIAVLNENDDVMFSNKKLSYLEELDLLYQLRSKENDFIKTNINSDLFNWSYSSLVPEDVIYQVPNRIKKILLILVILLFLIGFLISYYLSKRNYKRLLNIIEIIRHAEKEEELPELKENTNDEYAYITNKIIKTFLQNNYLKLQVSERKYKEKTLELMALQSQINPHFLYNTLETIYWKVFQFTKSPNQANKMLENLSDILKYSLHSPRKKVKIIEEVKNTKSYLEIQDIRYKDKFEIKWEYSKSIVENKIIKLILQPIVENSIYYGIKELNKKGKIKIKVLKSKKNKQIRISIIDNGKGIEKPMLQEIKKSLKKCEANNKNIGLQNTNKRLVLMYGEESQIHIRSKRGFGTVVYFYIPIEE